MATWNLYVLDEANEIQEKLKKTLTRKQESNEKAFASD